MLETRMNGTGYFYVTNSFNSDCSAPYASQGYVVGKCHVSSNFAYMLHFVQGMFILNIFTHS